MASTVPISQSHIFSHKTHIKNPKTKPSFVPITKNRTFSCQTYLKSHLSMATVPISQSHLFSNKTHIKNTKIRASFMPITLRNINFKFGVFGNRCSVGNRRERAEMPFKTVVVSATTAEKPKKRYPGEAKGFVEEMRFVAMKLHTRDQAKEGEKEADTQPVAKWEPSIEGYLRFLVDSKVVYDTLESIVDKAAFPAYAEFRNTGLERSDKLAKDLEWFKEQGHDIPEPSNPGISYARHLEELSEKDPPAFICHFYNVYFAHTAGGRMIGKKVAEKVLDNKELEFYKWDGELSQLLQNVRMKLNRIAESWSREEKDHCLKETEKSFKYSGEILRLILS